MRKRMLRSVLVAAFSAVVAFGTLSGLSGAKSEVRQDTAWSLAADTATVTAGDTSVTADDTAWS